MAFFFLQTQEEIDVGTSRKEERFTPPCFEIKCYQQKYSVLDAERGSCKAAEHFKSYETSLSAVAGENKNIL